MKTMKTFIDNDIYSYCVKEPKWPLIREIFLPLLPTERSVVLKKGRTIQECRSCGIVPALDLLRSFPMHRQTVSMLRAQSTYCISRQLVQRGMPTFEDSAAKRDDFATNYTNVFY